MKNDKNDDNDDQGVPSVGVFDERVIKKSFVKEDEMDEKYKSVMERMKRFDHISHTSNSMVDWTNHNMKNLENNPQQQINNDLFPNLKAYFQDVYSQYCDNLEGAQESMDDIFEAQLKDIKETNTVLQLLPGEIDNIKQEVLSQVLPDDLKYNNNKKEVNEKGDMKKKIKVEKSTLSTFKEAVKKSNIFDEGFTMDSLNSFDSIGVPIDSNLPIFDKSDTKGTNEASEPSESDNNSQEINEEPKDLDNA